MAGTPDITLLFGVAGGGSVSGESGRKISNQLSNIIGSINKTPLGIKVQIDQSSLKTMRSQLQSVTNSLASASGRAGSVVSIAAATTRTQRSRMTEENLAWREYEAQKVAQEKIRGEISKTQYAREQAAARAEAAALRATAKEIEANRQAQIQAENSTASLTKRYETLMSSMKIAQKSWTHLSPSQHSGLNGGISDLRTLKEQFDSNVISLQEFQSGLNRVDAAFAGIKGSVGVVSESTKIVERFSNAIKSSETLLSSMRDGRKNWTAMSPESASQLDSYIAQLQMLQSQFKSGQISLETFRSGVAGISASFSSFSNAIRSSGQDMKLFSVGSDEYWSALKRIQNLLTSVTSAQRNFTSAKTGDSKISYSALESYSNRLNSLISTLNSGKLTSGEFTRVFSEIEGGFARATARIKAAGENFKITDVTAKAANAIKSYESLLATMQGSRGKWTAMSPENTAQLNGYISRLQELQAQFKSGKISLDEFKSGMSSLSASYSTLSNTVRSTGQDTKLLTRGTEEYWTALTKLEKLLLTVTSAQKNFTAAKAGESKTSYSALESYNSRLTSIINTLKSGKFTSGDFNKLFSEIENGVTRATTRIKAAGENFNLTDITTKTSDAIRKYQDLIATMQGSRANWTAMSPENSTQLSNYIAQLQTLQSQFQSGAISLEAFRKGVASISAGYNAFSSMVRNSGQDTKLLARGTEEYRAALSKTEQLLLTITSAQKNFTAAKDGKSKLSYKALESYNNRLADLINTLNSGRVTSREFTSWFSEIENAVSNATNRIKLAGENLKTTDVATKTANAIKSYETVLATMQAGRTKWTAMSPENAAQLDSFIAQLQNLRSQFGSNQISIEEFRAGIANAAASFATFKNAITEAGQASALLKRGSAEQAAALAKVEQALLTATNAQKNFTAASNPSSKSYSSYTALSGYIARLQELKTKLESGTMSQQRFAQAFSPLNSGIKTSVSSIKMAGEATSSWSARLTALAKKFTTWFSMTTVIMRIYQSIRKMITSVIDLDAAMTELKKVTNETDAVYNKFLTNASERAKNLGASLKDVVSATADFSRLGYSISEAEKMADAALIYKTVGDGIEDINEASDSIVATMQAFGIGAEDAMSIVDKFNNVGRILPTYAVMYRKEK